MGFIDPSNVVPASIQPDWSKAMAVQPGGIAPAGLPDPTQPDWGANIQMGDYETIMFTGFGLGADSWTGQDGDPGGFANSGSGSTYSQFMGDAGNSQLSWWGTASSDLSAGNLSGADSIALTEVEDACGATQNFQQGDVGQGMEDIANGSMKVGEALGAIASAAMAAKEGFAWAAVGSSLGALDLGIQAFNSVNNQASADALASGFCSLDKVMEGNPYAFPGGNVIKATAAVPPSATLGGSGAAAIADMAAKEHAFLTHTS